MKASNESLVHQAKSGDKNALEALINRNSANAWRESETEAQQGLVVEEIMISCLQGLLLCLDREHRLAYILGEIFEVTAEQGSEKLGFSQAPVPRACPPSRFYAQKLCPENPANPCHCENQSGRN
jgi:hypothetical protein